MNSIEYGQTLAAAEMLQDQKHISKTMNAERSKIVHRPKSRRLRSLHYLEEVLIGTVEYNRELTGYQIVGLYRQDLMATNRPDGLRAPAGDVPAYQ